MAKVIPLVFQSYPEDFGYMYVKLKKQVDVEKAVAKIESIVKSNNPGYPFNYIFVDDEFDRQFRSEMLIGKLSRVFALLAIVITCLGLFGLAAYTAERRTKEIGIRKVLGRISFRDHKPSFQRFFKAGNYIIHYFISIGMVVHA